MKMRYAAKLTAVLMVMGMVVQAAFATATINFTTSVVVPPATTAGTVNNRSNTSAAPIDTWLIQLIWTANATPSVFNPLSPLTPGSDILLCTFKPHAVAGKLRSADYAAAYASPTPANPGFAGQQYTESNYGYGGSFVGGRVYARLFETWTPTIGNYYHEMSISGQISPPGGGSDTPLDYGIPSCYFDTQILVPEPATLGLFGLGLLTIALRRKLHK